MSQNVKTKDRVASFLKRGLSEFVFDSLSPEFLKKAGVEELMAGIPVPFTKEEFEQFSKGEGIGLEAIARNMAFVFGCDMEFKYKEHYLAFVFKMYGENGQKNIEAEAEKAAEEENFEKACILFRASLVMKPWNLEGMYGYARVCQELYTKGGDETFVGSFKAESIEYFELLTIKHPEFAEGYYYLGYVYTNLGLYVKANIVWKEYVLRSEDEEKLEEIKERLIQLEGPVEIELGCNAILSGRFEEGIEKLSAYKEGPFETWWPLWYYLGAAHHAMDALQEAETCLKQVLLLNPSNIDAMELLAQVYSELGNHEKEEKYRKKSLLVRTQMIEQ